MGIGVWNRNVDGVADVICVIDCLVGNTYELSFSASVPLGSPSGIGSERYILYLTEEISKVPLSSVIWLFNAGLVGLFGMTQRRKMFENNRY